MARRNGEIEPSEATAEPFIEGEHDDEAPVGPAPGGTSVDPAPVARSDGTEPGAPPPARPTIPPKRRTGQGVKAAPEESFTERKPAPGDNRTRVLDTRPPPEAKGAGRGELVVRAGPVAGLQFTLNAGAVVVVGRSSQADCTIPDEAVSRRHFELRVTPAGVYLRDLGSGNGTLVNGKRVDDTPLSDGDRIVVGDSTLEYRDRAARPGPKGDPSRARTDFLDHQAEPSSGFLSRLPPKQRRLVMFAVGACVVIIVFGMVGIGQSKKRSEERQAIKAFQRGRQEMLATPPDPDAAMDDFQLAIHAYPDPQMVHEAIDEAQAMSTGMRQLTHAHELAEQRDFEGARKQLQGLPKNDYFAAAIKSMEDELQKREAAKKAEDAAQAAAAVDPTTLAEVHDLWQRAKKAEGSSPDTAIQAYDQAYDMLLKRNATGPEFDKLKADYAGFLWKTSQALRRRNPSKAVALEGKARVVSPEAISALEAPPPQPQIRPISHVGPTAHLPRKKKHGGATLPSRPNHAEGDDADAHKGAAPAAKFDDDKADQLCDEGDALIGQDPDAAKKKYSEALKYAHPGSTAANRAREGLNN